MTFLAVCAERGLSFDIDTAIRVLDAVHEAEQRRRQELAVARGWQIESVHNGIAIQTVTPDGRKTYGLPPLEELEQRVTQEGLNQ